MTILSRTISSPRATRFFFDRVAPIYRWLTNNPMWIGSLHEMMRHLPPSASQLTLLDVGCGHGNSARQFLMERADVRVIGLDFSMTMLRMAQRMSRTYPLASWTQADVTHLPLPDASVDAITGHSIYYMLADRPAFLRECLRVLRPGGRLILLDPAARPFPFEMLVRVQQPRRALAVPLWHAVSLAHQRFSLEQMNAQLIAAGFARVLAESAAEGYGVLSRGEKPYAAGTSTTERIAQTATIDTASDHVPNDELIPIDSSALASYGRGRYVFLLVRQTPDKPAWAIQPDEPIQWNAIMLTDQWNRSYLLAFTSLPKAVEFMQPAVTNGLMIGVKKVAKFDKAIVSGWGVEVILNPTFDVLRAANQYTFKGVQLAVDPATAITGDE